MPELETPMAPRLYGMRTAARLLDVSVRTLQRLRARGEIRVVIIGPRGVKVPASEIERLSRPTVEA